jgi:hypothetical protein
MGRSKETQGDALVKATMTQAMYYNLYTSGQESYATPKKRWIQKLLFSMTPNAADSQRQKVSLTP